MKLIQEKDLNDQLEIEKSSLERQVRCTSSSSRRDPDRSFNLR